MKKEDYMKLSKERLAELCVEMESKLISIQPFPSMIPTPTHIPPCYAPDGICTNPFHDCVNCPKQFGSGGHWTTNTSGTIGDSNLQHLNEVK